MGGRADFSKKTFSTQTFNKDLLNEPIFGRFTHKIIETLSGQHAVLQMFHKNNCFTIAPIIIEL